jgi:hypothetical protein
MEQWHPYEGEVKVDEMKPLHATDRFYRIGTDMSVLSILPILN